MIVALLLAFLCYAMLYWLIVDPDFKKYPALRLGFMHYYVIVGSVNASDFIRLWNFN
jgi:ABC-type Mn2+/Zn2+ transport system permease subunit